MALLATQAMIRYLELSGGGETLGRSAAAVRCATNGGREDACGIDLVDCPGALKDEHVRALVRVEITARRWRIGLIEAGRRLYLERGSRALGDLERWGFVVDRVDDLRWLYFLDLSPLGRQFIERHPRSGMLRRQVWREEIMPGERADLVGS